MSPSSASLCCKISVRNVAASGVVGGFSSNLGLLRARSGVVKEDLLPGIENADPGLVGIVAARGLDEPGLREPEEGRRGGVLGGEANGGIVLLGGLPPI